MDAMGGDVSRERRFGGQRGGETVDSWKKLEKGKTKR